MLLASDAPEPHGCGQSIRRVAVAVQATGGQYRESRKGYLQVWIDGHLRDGAPYRRSPFSALMKRVPS
jgi:hypothetical protein